MYFMVKLNTQCIYFKKLTTSETFIAAFVPRDTNRPIFPFLLAFFGAAPFWPMTLKATSMPVAVFYNIDIHFTYM